MNVNYAILVGYSNDNKYHVMHMVLYEKDPTINDIVELKNELENDSEFNYIFNIEFNMEFIKCMLKDNEIISKEKIYL